MLASSSGSSRSAGLRLNRFFVADGSRHDVVIDLARCAAIEPEEVVLRFRRDDFVALAGQHIERRLGADDLARGGDERRIAHVFSDARDFIEDFLHPIQGVLFRQLCGQVREHTAGNLRRENFGIDPGEIAFELAILSANGPEMFGDRQEGGQVQPRVVGRILERGDQRFRRRMRCSAGQRRHGGVEHVEPAEDRHQGGHRGHARGVVGMQMDRHLHGALETSDEVIGIDRRQEAGHVFDAERVGAEIFQLLGHVDEPVDAVDRADRIADGGFDMFAAGFDLPHGPVEVAHIVERVEDAEDIDAVGCGSFDEPFQHIVGIMPVSDQVLSAQQHLESGVGHGGPQRPEPFPGIFFQEAQAGIERRTAPHFERPIADGVELLRDRAACPRYACAWPGAIDGRRAGRHR